jgi:hypothetical protein
MKIKLIIATLVVVFVLLASSVTPALALPPLPSGFWGTVKAGTSNVPVGTPVSALINGVVYAGTVTSMYQGDSIYFLTVPGDMPETPAVIEGGHELETVTFRIGISNAAQTGVWRTGTNINLNLSFMPTAVTVVDFSVTSQFYSALLEWQTANEIDLVGFNIYRSETENGIKQKQNATLIPASNSGQMIGSNYQLLDNVSQGRHYFYWLEVVDIYNYGQTYQMELTTPYLLFLPLCR